MRSESESARLSRRSEIIIACVLLAVGFTVRLILIGSAPSGLNQDEASAGYDAWAILNYGTDRNGYRLPVLLEAWGSGQNALYSYLAMPFIAVLGLSELSLRLPMALAGCLTLFVFWRLARRARGVSFGLTALFFLAVCPWHITASRWALESNLLPALLLCGVYFSVRAKEDCRWLIPAALCFSLSLYAYGTAYFLLPGMLIFLVVWLRREIRPAPFLLALCLFVVIALPITLCQLRNALGLGETTFLGLSLPALTEGRQLQTSVLGGGDMRGLWDNLVSLLKLLVTQTDGLSWNTASFGGIFYFFGLPLAVAGIVRAVIERKRFPLEAPMLAWLAFALLCGTLIDVNINRVNMLWLPLCWFAASGLDWLAAALGKYFFFPFAAVTVCFAVFCGSYVSDFYIEGNLNFFPGLGDCVEYVAEREPESAYISNTYVLEPYIFALFYSETPPEEFIDSVVYADPDAAFRQVSSFGYWRFGSGEDAEGEYLILHRAEAEEREILAAYGRYVVVSG